MKPLHAAVVACVLLCAPAAFAEGAPHTDAGKGSTRLTSAVSYVPLPTINAATAYGRGIGGMLSVDFGFDIPDAHLRTRAVAMTPRLMDSLRATVAEYALTRIRPGAPPDPDQLAIMAQASANRAMGVAGVRVLIINVMITDHR